MLCRASGISRQAYYGAQRVKVTPPTVVALPTRPGSTSAEAVLAAIRVVIAREPAWGGRKGWVAVALTIDWGCRTLVGLDVTKDQSAPAILHSIDAVLLEQSSSVTAVPADSELRSDHGSQYPGADCESLVTPRGLTHAFGRSAGPPATASSNA